MEVEITNFQSIEHATLEVRGLTVIVGKSNIGKSAVIRAVSGALSNRQGNDFVTEGATHSEVHLTVPATEGTPPLDLIWRKGGSHNDYVIDGVDLELVGRGAPSEVAHAGFRELEIGNKSVAVQVADQFSPLFLLDISGAVAAEAISDVDRLAEVQEALRSCDRDRREHKATRKVRTRDLSDLQAERAKFETYEEDMRQFKEMRSRWDRALGLEREITLVGRLVEGRTHYQDVVDLLEGVENVSVASSEDVQSCEASLREITELERLQGGAVRTLDAVGRYRDIGDVLVPEVPETVQTALREMEQAQDLLDRARYGVRTVKAFRDVEEFDIPDSLDVSAATEEIRSLEMMVGRLKEYATTGRDSKLGVAQSSEEMEALDKELHDLLHEAGICPTCAQEVH